MILKNIFVLSENVDRTTLISQVVSTLAFYNYNDMEMHTEEDASYYIAATHTDEGAVNIRIYSDHVTMESPDFVITNRVRDIINNLISRE